jgi:hypothetical protein
MPPRAKRFATPDEVLEQSQDWPDEWLYCRTSKHQDVPMDCREYPGEGIWRTRERCTRCSAILYKEVSARTGKVLASWRPLPPGYASKNGRIVGNARDVLRRESIRRNFKMGKQRKSDPDLQPRTIYGLLHEND